MTRSSAVNPQRLLTAKVTPGLDDPTILNIELAVSRIALLTQVADAVRALLKPHLPYRAVDPRVVIALKLRWERCLSYADASIAVFGTPDKADTLRYWEHEWGVS